MKKYCHVITALDYGGTENFLSRLLKSDVNNKHTLILLRSDKVALIDKFIADNVEIYLFNIKKIKEVIGLMRLIIRLSKEGGFLRCYTWLYHADLIGGILFKMLTNVDVVWSIRSTAINPKLLSPLTYMVVKTNSILSTIIPDSIIYCSAESMHEHIKFGYTSKCTSSVVHNAIPVNEMQSLNFIDRRLYNPIVIGIFARWDPNKGIDRLLKVLKLTKLDNIIFNFYGHNVDKNNVELQGFLKDGIANNINFFGHVDDSLAKMSDCSYVLIPSVSEGFPNVALEALMIGIPVVSRNVGAAYEIIRDNGILFETDEEMLDVLMNINNHNHDFVCKKKSNEIRFDVTSRFSMQKISNIYFGA